MLTVRIWKLNKILVKPVYFGAAYLLIQAVTLNSVLSHNNLSFQLLYYMLIMQPCLGIKLGRKTLSASKARSLTSPR